MTEEWHAPRRAVEFPRRVPRKGDFLRWSPLCFYGGHREARNSRTGAAFVVAGGNAASGSPGDIRRIRRLSRASDGRRT